MSSLLPLLLSFLLAIFLERSLSVVSCLEYSTDLPARNLTNDNIQKYLDKINKPAVITIKSSDGDIIDCIDQWKQPAFDHPLLKSHKLQLVPTEMPRVMKENHASNSTSEERVMDGGRDAWQLWHENGTSCPDGTVPIRRTTVDDVVRATSLSDFGKKQPKIALARHHVSRQAIQPVHEYATVYAQPSTPVYGATARINVWNPSVEIDTEFSVSQLWVVAGSFEASDLNTLEAGWQVFRGLYGDRRTRLFAYWTADAYKSKGCYNILCPGFVQVHKQIALGSAIVPVSTISGKIYDITLTIFKDPKTKNWWLSYGNNIAVGYWPSELFTHLSASASLVEWGGEVVNNKRNGVHTSTQMGSGRFAQERYGKASYFRNLGLVDSNNGISPPQQMSSRIDNDKCYNLNMVDNQNEWGTHFYYGGPGLNRDCP